MPQMYAKNPKAVRFRLGIYNLLGITACLSLAVVDSMKSGKWSKWSWSFWSKSISELGRLLTIYINKIYIIVADFDNPFSILTNDQMTILTT